MAAVPSFVSPFSLRPAVAGDFDGYMDAFEAVAAEGRWMGAEAPIDRQARRTGFDRAVAGDGATLFVAEAGGAIVGAVYASLSGGIADFGMFVVASHRGGGVGAALVEAVTGWARAAGAHKISLAAWPTNHPAVALYARYGFRVEGTRRRHYRRRSGALWDSLVMGLVLDEESPGGPGPGAGRLVARRAAIVVPDGGLAGDGVVLRDWRRSDIPDLVTLVDDPEIRRWIDILPDPYTPTDAEEYLAGARVDLTAGTAVRLAAVAGGRLAGSVDLRLGGHGSAQIGYWVAGWARGRGVASAAARALCDFGFGSLGLRRVELNAAVANLGSCRVAEKAGFQFEGVRRQWRDVGGAPADFALYARLASHPAED
jgi:RimJ/RimL family protein N-acetyltransferase